MKKAGKSDAVGGIIEIVSYVILFELVMAVFYYIVMIISFAVTALIAIIYYSIRAIQMRSLKEKCENMEITLPDKSCAEYCNDLKGLKIQNSKKGSYEVGSLSISGHFNGVYGPWAGFDFFKLEYMSFEEFEANSKLQIKGKIFSEVISVFIDNESDDFKLTFRLSYRDQFIQTYEILKTIIELIGKEKQREKQKYMEYRRE